MKELGRDNMMIKEISDTLNDFINRILYSGTLDSNYWFGLEKEVNEFIENNDIPEECLYCFEQSGAPESLYMICEGFRYEEAQNNNGI